MLSKRRSFPFKAKNNQLAGRFFPAKRRGSYPFAAAAAKKDSSGDSVEFIDRILQVKILAVDGVIGYILLVLCFSGFGAISTEASFNI
jgi:hypothetical protein